MKEDIESIDGEGGKISEADAMNDRKKNGDPRNLEGHKHMAIMLLSFGAFYKFNGSWRG